MRCPSYRLGPSGATPGRLGSSPETAGSCSTSLPAPAPSVCNASAPPPPSPSRARTRVRIPSRWYANHTSVVRSTRSRSSIATGPLTCCGRQTPTRSVKRAGSLRSDCGRTAWSSPETRSRCCAVTHSGSGRSSRTRRCSPWTVPTCWCTPVAGGTRTAMRRLCGLSHTSRPVREADHRAANPRKHRRRGRHRRRLVGYGPGRRTLARLPRVDARCGRLRQRRRAQPALRLAHMGCQPPCGRPLAMSITRRTRTCSSPDGGPGRHQVLIQATNSAAPSGSSSDGRTSAST
jgi:hypothetical protein